ncbi:putative transferase CAF17 homolog, mitochondrial [Cimex lectularius]|uniref:Aminomethyltransferase folate-binding domain-containing protein n=1 Tax=Cimex lectularius TaxID=79782 RepID=A0A8I6S9D6_CIMLE|nr:putative transferase CAF17 homolog, mitochondrial [Cimex lectularius]
MLFTRLVSRTAFSFFINVKYLSSGSYPCHVEELKDRAILRVSGCDASQFLQGLVTNDVRVLDTGAKNCIYTMFLNIKGRVLYDTLIYKDCNQGYLIECDQTCIQDLLKHIKMYKLRKNVVLELDLETRIRVIFGSVAHIDLTTGLLSQDPRHTDLGHRYLSDANVSTCCQPVNGLYKEKRFKLGIAEGVNEISKGEMFPLEMNLDYLDGVSFNKGCYLGQEVTSRTKHTGVVRKRLMPLEFLGNVKPRLEIKENEEGKREKTIGKIKAVYGTLGLGLVRLVETTSPAFKAAGIVVKRPTWWPEQNGKT